MSTCAELPQLGCCGGICDPSQWIKEPVEFQLTFTAPTGGPFPPIPPLPCSDGLTDPHTIVSPCIFPPAAIVEMIGLTFTDLVGPVRCNVYGVFRGCSGGASFFLMGSPTDFRTTIGLADPCGFIICLFVGAVDSCVSNSPLTNYSGFTVTLRVSPPPP